MVVDGHDPRVWVKFEDGKTERRGYVVGWTSRSKRIVAMVLSGKRFYALNFEAIRSTHAPHTKRKK